MSLSDPISNMLAAIKNAIRNESQTVDVPASKLTGRILEIFKKDGYIEDYRLLKNNSQGTFKIYLKYDNKKPVITGVKRISKSGLRIFSSAGKIPLVLNGLGTAVISTSKGVISGREAYKLKVGGEVLCYIW